MSHLVSPCFANFPGGGAGVLCLFCWVLGCVCLVLLFFVCFQGISAVISFLSHHIPVVDRQCLVLARQCRKKKKKLLTKQSLVGCAKAHPASTLEVTQIQPLAHSSLRRSSRFLMAPSASHSVVNSLPSTALISPRMFVPQLKNSPARRALTNLCIHV